MRASVVYESIQEIFVILCIGYIFGCCAFNSDICKVILPIATTVIGVSLVMMFLSGFLPDISNYLKSYLSLK